MESCTKDTSAPIYPAFRIAALCGGKLDAHGRGILHCPGPLHKRNDRNKSLSVKDGPDHRALLNCFAGCTVTSILNELGLTKRDLFVKGPPLTAAECKEAALRERSRRKWEEAQRLAARRVRDWTHLRDEFGSELAALPDGDGRERELTRLYHFTLDRLRAVEAEQTRLGKQAAK